MSRITRFLTNLYAVAISAEAVARDLRRSDLRKAYELVCPDGEIWKCLANRGMAMEVASKESSIPGVGFLSVRPYVVESSIGEKAAIADWQPELNPGFQGRQLLVVASFAQSAGEHPSLYTHEVVAAGNDGEVRLCLAELVRKVEEGQLQAYHPSYSTGSSAVVTMIDKALSQAMPSSYLHDLETVTTFSVVPPNELTESEQRRLRMYADAAVAPLLLDVPELSWDGWTIHWTMLANESLYALCEIYGGPVCRITGAVTGRSETSDGALFLVRAYQCWFTSLRHAA